MKMLRYLVTLLVVLSVFLLFTGCESLPTTDNLVNQALDQSTKPYNANENLNSFVASKSTKQYYTKEDFNSLVIGESTFSDACNLFPPKPMSTAPATSYGVYCDYPMHNGGYIRLKFCGNDLLLFAIEEIE